MNANPVAALELLPCPFCGGAGNIDKGPVSGSLYGACQICYSATAPFPDGDPAKVAAAWNTRAPLSTAYRAGEGDGWQDIASATESHDDCWLWCPEYRGDHGQVVRGRVFNGVDGIYARGNGMYGDWTYTHFIPIKLPASPTFEKQEQSNGR